jgi:hypothetical protein
MKYIFTDQIRVPLRAELVVMELCQRHSGIRSCGLCIFNDSWCGWRAQIGSIKVSVTDIGLLRSAQWNTSENWGVVHCPL